MEKSLRLEQSHTGNSSHLVDSLFEVQQIFFQVIIINIQIMAQINVT